MAHEIFGTRFVGMREPAWHSLGTVIPEDQQVTTKEALKIAGITYQFHRVPMGYTLPDGTFRQSADRQIILREPTDDDPEWVELGLVGSDYHFLQNADLANGLDKLAAETGWKFETVGALQRGATTFMTLRTGRRSVFGDAFDTHVILSDGKANGRALQIVTSRTRVVCANTLASSEWNAMNKFKIAHDSGIAAEFEFWVEMIANLQKAQDASFAELEALAQVKIDDDQAREIFARAYPLPEKNDRARQAAEVRMMVGIDPKKKEELLEQLLPGERAHEYWTKYHQARREASFVLYQRLNAGEEQGAKDGRALDKKTIKQLSNTAYFAVQAVAELVDWGGRTGRQAAAVSSLWGSGAETKQRAMKAARELVPVG